MRHMRTLITNIQLWDGHAAALLPGAAVLLDGGAISWAGPQPDAPEAARTAERVDGGGGTLLPGLIDAHMHLASFRGDGPDGPLATALSTAARALQAGLTTVRDLGARDHSAIAAGRAIAAGTADGPFVIAAGRPLSLPGGYMRGVAVEVSTPEAVRAAVAEQIAAGAGVIKVIASPVPPEPDPALPRSFGLDNLRAAADAAHAARLRLTAHAHSLAGARDAVLAGLDCIEHGYRLDAATVAEMAARGTWLVPTMVAMEAAQAPQWVPGRPDETARRARERWEAAVESARMAHAAGIRIATGTDAASIVPVDSVRREVRLLVEAAGLSPVAALRAATSAAATLLAIDHQRGTVAAGFRADLLLVDGDPLSDPEALARPRALWREGRRVHLT